MALWVPAAGLQQQLAAPPPRGKIIKFNTRLPPPPPPPGSSAPHPSLHPPEVNEQLKLVDDWQRGVGCNS